jgi:hypothetical protein
MIIWAFNNEVTFDTSSHATYTINIFCLSAIGSRQKHCVLVQKTCLDSAQFGKWVATIIRANGADSAFEMDGVSRCYNWFFDWSNVISGKAAC